MGKCDNNHEEKEWALVKVSPNSAYCDTGEDGSNPACFKEDPTYDLLQADFAFPGESAISILVCNGSLYAVGEWIQFVNAEATVQILSITNNQLTVQSRCTNGSVIPGNPTPGTIIRRNDAIIPASAPECLTDEQRIQRLEAILANSTELCIPQLAREVSSTSEMELVGWKRDDPSDSTFKKCMKRIKNVFFRDGHPFFTGIRNASREPEANFRSVFVNKNDGELVSRESPESPLRFVFMNRRIFNVGGDHPGDHNNYLGFGEGSDVTYNLDMNIPEITNLDIRRDKFYVDLFFQFVCDEDDGEFARLRIYLNGKEFSQLTHDSHKGSENSFMYRMELDRNDRVVPMRLTVEADNLYVHASVSVLGVYY